MKTQPLDFEKPIVELEEKLADLRTHSREQDINFETEVHKMELKLEETKVQIYQNLTAWERVQIARHSARPFALDYLQLSFNDFLELHGDRLFADDRAMPGGFASFIDSRPEVTSQRRIAPSPSSYASVAASIHRVMKRLFDVRRCLSVAVFASAT